MSFFTVLPHKIPSLFFSFSTQLIFSIFFLRAISAYFEIFLRLARLYLHLVLLSFLCVSSTSVFCKGPEYQLLRSLWFMVTRKLMATNVGAIVGTHFLEWFRLRLSFLLKKTPNYYLLTALPPKSLSFENLLCSEVWFSKPLFWVMLKPKWNRGLLAWSKSLKIEHKYIVEHSPVNQLEQIFCGLQSYSKILFVACGLNYVCFFVLKLMIYFHFSFVE